jgi:broad specificity phosphatase PhoE
MKIYLIRHGHAAHNLGFQTRGEEAYSSTDYYNSALTELGHTQTKKVGEKFEGRVLVDRVYCSPLKRCVETARNIFGKQKVLYLWDGLVETKGTYPCNHRPSVEEIRATYERVNLENVSPDWNNLEPEEDWREGTDGLVALQKRAKRCLGAIMEEGEAARLKSIAIVSHCDWIYAIIGTKIKNAEVVAIEG